MGELNKKPKCREELIIEVVNFYRLSDCQEFHQMPTRLQVFFESFSDIDLKKRAVYWLRREKGFSYSYLARRYSLTVRQVEYMIKNFPQDL